MSRKGFHRFNNYKSPTEWQKFMLFMQAGDGFLYKLTIGQFPDNNTLQSRGPNSSHPIFILGVLNFKSTVCPCTSLPKENCRYIKAKEKIAPTKKIVELDTYILDDFLFPFPLDGSYEKAFSDNLDYYGIVKKDQISKSPVFSAISKPSQKIGTSLGSLLNKALKKKQNT